VAAVSGTFVIMDIKALRREWLASHVKIWAEANSLDIVTLDPSHALDEFCEYPDCRMVILSLGVESVADADTSKLIKALRALVPCAALVVVSDSDQPWELVAAVEAGAVGFVSTNHDPDLVLRALSFILDGGSYFPAPAILGAVGRNGGNGRNGLSETPLGEDDDSSPGGVVCAPRALTARQQEVLELLQLGESNKHIARHLGMTESTAKVHVRHIMRKFGATNRTQAALSAKFPQKADEPKLADVLTVLHH
jgi:DNA-binding NarL/FixJ family response regulator